MGANLSTPEKIAKLARQGDAQNLQLLLSDLARNDAQFRNNRARYLEVADESGNTPLTLAAAKGSLPCVRVLLQYGANIHACNRKPDGGTALHEAVAHKQEALVELLLQQGANPFVENVKGFTAMDIACSTRNPALLRRLEQCAPYTGWLMMKVPQYAGLGSTWQRRWVVISHRYPYPQAPAARQLTHCVFLAYKTLANTAPSCRVWLDGARAREVYNPKAVARLGYGVGPGRVAQAGITLHRKHEQPSGVYTTGGHTAGVGHAAGGEAEGYTFYLRPDDGSLVAIEALEKLIRVVNNRGFPPSQQQPGGIAGPAASQQQSPRPTPPPQQQSQASQQQWPPPAVGVLPPAAPAQQQLAQQPPPPSPLFSSLPPGAAAAAPPANWGYPPGMPGAPSRPGPAVGTESDEEIARRLQEEYDAEALRQQLAGASTSSAPAGTPAAFYPAVHGDEQPGSAPPQRPPAQHAQGTGSLQGYPTAPATMAAAMQEAAAEASTAAAGTPPPRPGAEAVPHIDSMGRPSAPLLDLDYPPVPPAVGVLPISASGRNMSAPRLEDDSWWDNTPAAPPSRPHSESGAASAAAAAAASATVPSAGNEGDDSAMCVYCLDNLATAGVLHGDSVHKCLCKECCQLLKQQGVQSCPMCRKPVEAYIMHVFG